MTKIFPWDQAVPTWAVALPAPNTERLPHWEQIKTLLKNVLNSCVPADERCIFKE